MATQDSMIAGLFQDPQQYQQAQLQQQMKQNYEIAQMTPEQQVTGGLRTAGYQLGQGLGGLMGAEDPQMKLQSLRKQVLQSVDRNDPKALAEAAQVLNQAGDSQGAQALFQTAQARAKDIQDAEYKQSQITKNLKEGNASMLTTDQRNFAQAREEGYKGSFNQWLTEQSTAKGTKLTMPEIKIPADVNALISSYEKAVESDVEVKNLAGTAKGLINQAATSNNPSAWEAARTQTAKAVGQGKLSNEDIARIGVDPTLIGGVRDWIEKKTVGVPDANTQKALFAVASYLEKTASGRIAEKRNSRIAAARGINPNIDTGMMFPDYSGTVQAPASGGKIVDFKDFGKKVTP